jgi:hypothetical protein
MITTLGSGSVQPLGHARRGRMSGTEKIGEYILTLELLEEITEQDGMPDDGGQAE